MYMYYGIVKESDLYIQNDTERCEKRREWEREKERAGIEKKFSIQLNF